MGPVSHITTGAASNDISSFQVENIISYVTEVELPSGEIVDDQNEIEDGIEHQGNGLQTEEPGAVGGGVQENGGADETAGSTTQSVVPEAIPADSDEEVEDLSQPDELDDADNNAGVNSQSADTGEEAGPTEASDGASVDPEETTTQLFGANEDVVQPEGGAGTTLQISSGTAVIVGGVTTVIPVEEAASGGSMEDERSSTRLPHGQTTAETSGSAEEAHVEEHDESNDDLITTEEEERTSTKQPPGQTAAQSSGIAEEIGEGAHMEEHGESNEDLITTEEDERSSTRHPPDQTTADSSGFAEEAGEASMTADPSESKEDLITAEEEEDRSSTRHPVDQTSGEEAT